MIGDTEIKIREISRCAKKGKLESDCNEKCRYRKLCGALEIMIEYANKIKYERPPPNNTPPTHPGDHLSGV